MNSLESIFGPNAALVEELYKQYHDNPESVPDHWKKYFDEIDGQDIGVTEVETKPAPATNGAPTIAKKEETRKLEKPAPKPKASTPKPKDEGQDLSRERIKGVASKIVENMEASLAIPTATSLRVLPVKLMMEDRVIINRHLEKRQAGKVTYTHFIAWAIIKALQEFPSLNSFYEIEDGKMHRSHRSQVNLGLAIDLPGRDGKRNLVVPNIKAVDKMSFRQFLDAYTDLISRARNGKLDIPDYQGTSISITNPGMIGTVSSIPRLMQGQGAIIATGSIEYPAEFQAMSREILDQLGVSPVMTVTCTYDHRIIQGAESGNFLKRIHELLTGSDGFYEGIFSDLDLPYDPIPYGVDTYGGELNTNGTIQGNKKAVAVMQLINMYRTRGHVLADLNPLKHGPGQSPELDFPYYGLTMWDLDREFFCGGLGGYEKAPLRVIVKLLRDTYCGYIGAEYMHILDLEERKWLSSYMESTSNNPNLSFDDKKQILHKLNQASAFEEFLHKKFIGHKRFSLEGAETLIPMLDSMIDLGADLGLEEVVFGMAHRGRLNVLVNTLGKSYQKVFSEFEGYIDPKTTQGSGDVKYHLGARGKHKSRNGKNVKLQLMPNPSHLEAVNPVAEGAVRAKQDQLGKGGVKKIMSLLIHGDAAFAGQGVVAETLNMSQLDGYKTGGTVHIIVNNQIGFTTLPKDGRSTEYASDLAKMILAPIFHVNGDEPEAAVHAIRMAMEYRQKFGKDVVVDLICYRKYGHNEGDEPAFTQPDLYEEIKNHASVRDIYADELVRRKDFGQEDVAKITDEFEKILEDAFDQAKNLPSVELPDELVKRKETKQFERPALPDTGYPTKGLVELAVKLNTVPKDFDANPKLLRILAKRAEIVQKNEKKIDWGFAEALAFGSILKEGIQIRLTGQDSERGTFSHRHSVLHGTQTSQKFVPLNNLSEDQASYQVYNSFLSEFAVLGFEFGYSASSLDTLVLWEAQFGDFSNGAQIIIDQFIASSEKKWGQQSNVVMLLPHGFEGQGPEHSSARIERYLQLCAEDNMVVCNPTTPAQAFHLFRRQALKDARRPLIMFTPKSLLRHPKATASADELCQGSFQKMIFDERFKDASQSQRLVVCSGKVYYDLLAKREEKGLEDSVNLVRLEQYYPFPDGDFENLFHEHSHLDEIFWCQEEPRNMGAWSFVWPRMLQVKQNNQSIRFVGRDASASPAAGSAKLHKAEQDLLVSEALGVYS